MSILQLLTAQERTMVVVRQYTARERTMAPVCQSTATQEQDETEHKEVEVKARVQTDEPELVEPPGKCNRVLLSSEGGWLMYGTCVCVCREQRRGRTREKERSHGMATSTVQATTGPG